MVERSNQVRVVVLEDDEVVRLRICLALSRSSRDIVVLWQGGTAESLLDWLETGHALVDVAFVDLGLPGLSGPDMVRAVRQCAPHVAVVALTVFDDAKTVLSVLKVGAAGYLAKHVDDAQIEQAALAAASGGSPMTPYIARLLLDAWTGSSRTDPFDRLTEREHEVLALLARGRSYVRVAEELSIGLGTVQGHVKNIYGKLQISSRAEAAILVRRRGLLG